MRRILDLLAALNDAEVVYVVVGDVAALSQLAEGLMVEDHDDR